MDFELALFPLFHQPARSPNVNRYLDYAENSEVRESFKPKISQNVHFLRNPDLNLIQRITDGNLNFFLITLNLKYFNNIFYI